MKNILWYEIHFELNIFQHLSIKYSHFLLLHVPKVRSESKVQFLDFVAITALKIIYFYSYEVFLYTFFP